MIALTSHLAAAIPVAFVAGLISFLSPCVFPLLPGYLAFLGGMVGNEGSRGTRGRAVLGALSFVAGFTLVFVSAGFVFGGLGHSLRSHHRGIEIVFGSLTVVMGVVLTGIGPMGPLLRERRSHFLPRATILGAGLLGFLFALGWTPCIGPTLSAILGLAASSTSATATRGTVLALVYCLGLGVPFIVFAMAGEWASVVWKRLRSHLRGIAIAGGLFLVVLGLCEVLGWWTSLVQLAQDHLPQFNLPL